MVGFYDKGNKMIGIAILLILIIATILGIVHDKFVKTIIYFWLSMNVFMAITVIHYLITGYCWWC